jgi:hypothetical protein
MNREYKAKLGKYKYEPLDYKSWVKYVAETYEKMRSKSLDKKIKDQTPQIKENVIQFCTR